MWTPNENGMINLVNMFKESKSIDNKKQHEIYEVKIKIKNIFLET
jgi:hypothetical protein